MIKLARATYAINAAQATNMVVSAFVVPLVIGITSYGKFAAVFAAPAFAQSMLEAFATVQLATQSRHERFWLFFTMLASVSLALVFLIYATLFDTRAAALSVVLGAALIFRGAASAAVYTDSSRKYLPTLIWSEFITLAMYAIVLAVALLVHSTSYVVPVAMISLGAIFSGAAMLILHSHAPHEPIAAPRDSTITLAPVSLRLLLSRIYEDTILTLMPLLLARTFGLTLAGEFRILVSTIKALSKVFPFRYEILLRSLMVGEFHFSTFLRVALIFATLGIPLYLAVEIQDFFVLSNPSLALIALTAGMLVTSLAAFPAATAFSAGLSITSLVLAGCLFAVAALTPSVLLFVVAYSATNVAIYCYTLAVLGFRTMGAKHEKQNSVHVTRQT